MPFDLSGNEFEFLRRKLARGEVVLFLGAGFSADAKNRKGDNLPLGARLAELLAERAGLTYAGEPLTNVYQVVRPRIGDKDLWAYLQELFHVNSYDDWYDLIPQFVWHRIYTLNIDNLLDVIYSKSVNQQLTKIVCPAFPAERDQHFDKLQCVHLHGHIDFRDKGIVFSLQEFAHQTASPQPWYQQLVEDLFTRPILFVGTPLQEPMLYHYLEMRGVTGKYPEVRPRSYLANRTIGMINSEAFRERNIHTAECSAGDFFKALAASVDMQTYSLSAVRAEVFPHIAFGRTKGIVNPDVERYFDLILHNALPPSPKMPHGAFFMGGEPTWSDIVKKHDGARAVTAELKQQVLTPSTNVRLVALLGPAGSGKTTTMMRLAVELAEEGHTVFYAVQEERLDFAGLIQLLKTRVAGGNRSHVYVFVDVVSRHIAAFDALRPEMATPLPLTVVIADRGNSYINRCASLMEYKPLEVQMPDLCETDVVAIIEKLEQFGFLGELRGKTQEMRLKAFMDAAQKQLLVAMREATSVVPHADGILFRAFLARVTFCKISSAFLVHTNDLGLAL